MQELQSELVHVSRLTAMGEMASSLAHELNHFAGGDTAEHLVLGVDDPPLARQFGRFCRKRFHVREKSTETTGEGRACQPMRHIGFIAPNG